MTMTRLATPPRTTRADFYRVFIFFLCAFWLTNCGFDTSESIGHLSVTKRILLYGELGFEHPINGIFTTASNGRTYGSHEIGNAILLLPIAAISHGLGIILTQFGFSAERITRLEPFLVSFQTGIYAALILTFVFLILTQDYGQTRRAAFLGCLSLGFGTFFWSYSRILYDGVLCGLLLIAAVWALLRYRATGSLAWVALGFCFLGYAVDTRLSMIVFTVTSLAFAFIVAPRWKVVIVAGVALMPFAIWQLWYNNLRTGNMLVSPVQTAQYAGNNALDGDWMTGLIGLLVSPGKGLFIYAPLLTLSILSFPRFWRRDRAMAAFVLAGVVFWLLLHAKLRSWYGAWGWGPRHMITIVPLFALPGLVCLPELWSHTWSRIVAVTTIGAGFFLAAASIIGNWHYRIMLAEQQCRLADELFVWGQQNQAIDMVVGVGRNMAVLVGVVPPVPIPDASELNNYASNHVNVWWLTLQHAGVPWPVTVIACIPLVVGLARSARYLLRAEVASADEAGK